MLILDDYHLIENPAIHQGVMRLLQRMPRHLHLILISRTIPPFPLARLRANQELIEADVEDLRFRPVEIAIFLRQVAALPLEDQAVDRLVEQTEGWIAGLQLASLYWRELGHDPQQTFHFNGSHAFVVDYLTEEVTAHLPVDALLIDSCAAACSARYSAVSCQRVWRL